MLKKIISLVIVLVFGFESTGFAQVAGQLDISSQVSAGLSNIIQDKFRPIHLRYLSFNPTENNFKLLLDKGSLKNPDQQLIDETTKELLKYFLIGVTLPNDSFWVNLRPDATNEVMDESLAKTDVGKILIEADLQLKRDTAKYTSPQTQEGKEYWNKLYQKAEELYGTQQITIPTLNRPWIVPDEIIVRENQGSAYIYKATMKVMLEDDYLKGSQTYNFTDDKAKALNEYSSQLLKETIIPKITKEINSAKRYASLRQVYYSLILAQWFKKTYRDSQVEKINSRNLTGLTSKETWSRDTYYQAYQKSFKDGEYNIKEPKVTSNGQIIRNYISGGVVLTGVELSGAIEAGLVHSNLELPNNFRTKCFARAVSLFQNGSIKIEVEDQLRPANIWDALGKTPEKQFLVAVNINERAVERMLIEIQKTATPEEIDSLMKSMKSYVIGNHITAGEMIKALNVNKADFQVISELEKVGLQYKDTQFPNGKKAFINSIEIIKGIAKKSKAAKILIVEDTIRWQESYKKLLQRIGFVEDNIKIFSTAEEGIAAYKNNFFDLVITDFNFPWNLVQASKENGINFAQEIRNINKEVLIIMSSASDFKDSRIEEIIGKHPLDGMLSKIIIADYFQSTDGDGGFLLEKLYSLEMRGFIQQIEGGNISALADLSRINDPSAVKMLLQLFNYNFKGEISNNTVRVMILDAFRKIIKKDKSALVPAKPDLKKYILESKDYLAMIVVVEMLGVIGDESDVDFLMKVFKTDFSEISNESSLKTLEMATGINVSGSLKFNIKNAARNALVEIRNNLTSKSQDKIKEIDNLLADGGLDTIDVKGFAQEIDYLMNMLGIKDYPRAIQIFKTAIDPVAFVTELQAMSKATKEEVLSKMEEIDYFKSIVANYRARDVKKPSYVSRPGEKIEVSLLKNGSFIQSDRSYAHAQEIPDYLNLMHKVAGNVPFVFRDDMLAFVARFLGLQSDKLMDNDLAKIIIGVESFLTKVDLNETKYVLTSGIGANEMYSHQLAAIVNAYFKDNGIEVQWIVVNNPAHLNKIPQAAVNKNTIIFEMSRSGSTKETIDFFNATKNRFKQRIVAANSGKLKESAESLSKESDAAVYIIDDTPGDIGGRQMNRKTLMTYVPLFMALSAGLKDLDVSKEYLKVYVSSLLDANTEYTYANQKNDAISLSEMLYRNRAAGRNKFSVVYDESLKSSAKELLQLLNEGANKIIAGGTNNNILDGYNLQLDSDRFKVVFDKSPNTQLPIFLLNKNSKDYGKTLSYIQELNNKGIAVIVLDVDLTNDLKSNLAVIAKLSALMQDMVVYFTYITNQDANSNPAVKFVREITAAMFDILKDKKAAGSSDIKISFDDVLKKINEKQATEEKSAKDALDKKDVKVADYRAEFDALSEALKTLGQKLGVSENSLTRGLIRSTATNVVMSDLGEAGGSKVSMIDESFRRSALTEELGVSTLAEELVTLDKQVVLSKTDQMQISVAVNKDREIKFSNKNLAENLANYFYSMYLERKEKLMYMPLTYMEVDNDNKLIGQIAQNIIDTFADMNITAPLLALPGVAHTGIEAIMSHPENVFNIAVVYTNTYGQGLGTTEIEKGVTVDDATYVYGISNIVRMAKAGTPSIIFEVQNGQQLAEVKEIINETLKLFREKIDKEDGGSAEARRVASLSDGGSRRLNLIASRAPKFETGDLEFLQKMAVEGTKEQKLQAEKLIKLFNEVKAIRNKLAFSNEYIRKTLESYIGKKNKNGEAAKVWIGYKGDQDTATFILTIVRDIVKENDEYWVETFDYVDHRVVTEKIQLNKILYVKQHYFSEDGGFVDNNRLRAIASKNLWVGAGFLPKLDAADYDFLRQVVVEGTKEQKEMAKRIIDLHNRALSNKKIDDGGAELTVKDQENLDALRWYMASSVRLRIMADMFSRGAEPFDGKVKNILLDGRGIYWIDLDNGQSVALPTIKDIWPADSDGGGEVNKKDGMGGKAVAYRDASDSVGGIDFRTLPIMTQQAISNLSNNVVPVNLLMSKIEVMDLDKKIEEMQKMLDAGFIPSADRVKEIVQVACLKDQSREHLNSAIDCIAQIMKIDEDKSCRTSQVLKDILLVLESGMSNIELKKVFVGAKA